MTCVHSLRTCSNIHDVSIHDKKTIQNMTMLKTYTIKTDHSLTCFSPNKELLVQLSCVPALEIRELS